MCGIAPVQSYLQKYFPSRRMQISSLSRAVLFHRGALRNVINAGWDAVDAGGAQDEGVNFADGEVVWS